MFGSKFTFMSKLRTYIHKNTILATLFLFLFFMLMFSILLYEFEVKIYNMQGLISVYYYLVITMTAIGFGDFYAQTF